MKEITHSFSTPPSLQLTDQDVNNAVRFYEANAPEHLPILREKFLLSRIPYQAVQISKQAVYPAICDIKMIDWTNDQQVEALVCDCRANKLIQIRSGKDGWEEIELADFSGLGPPVRVSVFDYEGDGDLDMGVAIIGSLPPTDELVGSVVLLINHGKLPLHQEIILRGVPRLTDVQPGDFDGDGDLDFVVAMFGSQIVGKVGWLEHLPSGTFQLHELSKQAGSIRVPPIDLNGDGRLDFIALISQEHEEIKAFINQGDGRFEEKEIFRADTPGYGSSSMQLIDLDQDGDQDILYGNGDYMDTGLKPYHGIQWLENQGQYRFKFHDILRFYGIYQAAANDLDQDGDLDIVVASIANTAKGIQQSGLVWLENDGAQDFRPWAISSGVVAAVAVGDFTGDGAPDILAGEAVIRTEEASLEPKNRVMMWTAAEPK